MKVLLPVLVAAGALLGTLALYGFALLMVSSWIDHVKGSVPPADLRVYVEAHEYPVFKTRCVCTAAGNGMCSTVYIGG